MVYLNRWRRISFYNLLDFPLIATTLNSMEKYFICTSPKSYLNFPNFRLIKAFLWEICCVALLRQPARGCLHRGPAPGHALVRRLAYLPEKSFDKPKI